MRTQREVCDPEENPHSTVLVPRSQTYSLQNREKYISAVHNPSSLWYFGYGSPDGLRLRLIIMCLTLTTILWNKYHYHHPSLFWWGNWGTKNSRTGACNTACKSQSQDSRLLTRSQNLWFTAYVHWLSLGFFISVLPESFVPPQLYYLSVSVIGNFFLKVIYF